MATDWARGEGSLGPVRYAVDTPDDYHAVNLGIHLQQEGYAPDQTLTLTEFDGLIVSYDHNAQLAHATGPSREGPPSASPPYGPRRFEGVKSPPRTSGLFPSFQR